MTNDPATSRTSCSFAGKHTGGDTFFIAIELYKSIEGLPDRSVLGLELRDPESKSLAAEVESFLNENIIGISLTTWKD